MSLKNKNLIFYFVKGLYLTISDSFLKTLTSLFLELYVSGTTVRRTESFVDVCEDCKMVNIKITLTSKRTCSKMISTV